jgi:hypothetical protein
VTFLAVGGAGIRRHRYQIAQVAGVADGRVDALIGQDAGNNQRVDPKIAQHIIDIGRDEH